LTFTKSLFIKHCQQNILHFLEIMVLRKLYDCLSFRMKITIEHNLYTHNNNILLPCRHNTDEYRVFQKELYNFTNFKCGSTRGGSIGYYSTTCMKGIMYPDMLQEFLIPSLWLRYGPLDLGVGVTVEVP
jgi:hypothetical protein